MNSYCCDCCDFLFRRSGAVRECPACESVRIRSATPEEEIRLDELLKKAAAKPSSD